VRVNTLWRVKSESESKSGSDGSDDSEDERE
jgi:hypothetical protein